MATSGFSRSLQARQLALEKLLWRWQISLLTVNHGCHLLMELPKRGILSSLADRYFSLLKTQESTISRLALQFGGGDCLPSNPDQTGE